MSGHDLDLPFEEVPGGPVHAPLENPIIAGGLVVRAAVLPTEAGPMPALVFDFKLANGTAAPPIVFVSDADQVGKLSPLIEAAVRAALAGAEAAA
jgi:hypothetical protein